MCVTGSQRPSKVEGWIDIKKDDNLKINYVKDTIAYRRGNEIFLHEDLKNYPKLHEAILKHEFEHDDSTFSIKDFFHDVSSGLPKEELKAFRRSHRDLALRMMLPINRFGVNYNLIGVYIMFVAIVYLTMRSVLWIGVRLL